MKKLYFILLCLMLFPLTSVAEEQRQDDANKKIGDWVYRCDVQGAAASKCVIAQRHTLADSSQIILTAIVGYLGKEKPLLVLETPLGVFLPVGMALKVDQGKEYRAMYRVCKQGGCQASMEINDELLEQMKKGKSMVVMFLIAEKQQQINIDVSLKGFTRAHAALK